MKKSKEERSQLSRALDEAESSVSSALTPGEDGFDVQKAEEIRAEIVAEIEEKIKKAVASIKKNTAHGYSIQTKVELIERAKIMLDKYIANVLVLDGTPRAYEVFANLVKSISDMAERVIKLEQNTIPKGEGEGEQPKRDKHDKEIPALSTQDVLDTLVKGRYSAPVDVSSVNVTTDDDDSFEREE